MVPLPRHFYGELARTPLGVSLLLSDTFSKGSAGSVVLAPPLSPIGTPTVPYAMSLSYDVFDTGVLLSPLTCGSADTTVVVSKSFGVISGLLQTALSEEESGRARRGALWGIGHIACASDYGCSAVLDCCPLFLNWCTEQVMRRKWLMPPSMD